MKLGFIRPTYPNEKRVALLPEHISNFENDIVIESGFGQYMDISDEEYKAKNCSISTREDIFRNCDSIFCLKLLQPEDYQHLRDEQMIIGWTHPTGSGESFMKEVAIPKALKIVDLDNIYPTLYYKTDKIDITHLPKNFAKKNSFLAGFSATTHALLSYGKIPSSNTKVAILSAGNVSQGAFNAISKYTDNIQLFYRKTMDEFYNCIEEFDIIINGIEVDTPGEHIISKSQQKKIKAGSLIVDAAADAGNAIEGTSYTKISNPIYKENGLYFYVVNNAPSIYHRDSSFAISEAFSRCIYTPDIKVYYDLLK